MCGFCVHGSDGPGRLPRVDLLTFDGMDFDFCWTTARLARQTPLSRRSSTRPGCVAWEEGREGGQRTLGQSAKTKRRYSALQLAKVLAIVARRPERMLRHQRGRVP